MTDLIDTTPATADARLPTMRELGDDLLVTTPRQRWS